MTDRVPPAIASNDPDFAWILCQKLEPVFRNDHRISELDKSRKIMTRRVNIGEAKTQLSALLAKVEAGEDLVICRGSMPIAHVTGVTEESQHAALVATMRRDRAKQKPVTTAEILSWRHG